MTIDPHAPVALITGGGSGLGAAIARRFAGAGWRVVLGDVDAAAADRVAAETDGRAQALDVRAPAAWAAAIAALDASEGRLDALVNAAGILRFATIADCDFETFRHVQAVNVDGVFLGCQAALPLLERQGGAIVNLSSVSGQRGGRNLIAYNASKGAVRMMTRSIALHCARVGRGVRCNSVSPSFARTAMLDDLLAEPATAEKLARQIPIGRLIEPAEVAALALFLCGPEAAAITGADYAIDGGLTA